MITYVFERLIGFIRNGVRCYLGVGGILSGPEISKQIRNGRIKIMPEPTHIGPNSVDLHLGEKLFKYRDGLILGMPGGMRNTLFDLEEVPVNPEGYWILEPGVLYLAATKEWTETHGFVPWIDGRSTLGRMGVAIHVTAGKGDNGFVGCWTLEIFCIQRAALRPGSRCCQISYFDIVGDQVLYGETRDSGRYAFRKDPAPSDATSLAP